MRFYRAFSHACDGGDLVDGLSFHHLQDYTGALFFLQDLQCLMDIHLQVVVMTWRGFVLYCLRGDVFGEMLSAGVVVEHVVGDTVEPRGETGDALERVEMGVGLEKCLLCQVVAQCRVTHRLVQEKPSHRRLVFPDKLLEGPTSITITIFCGDRHPDEPVPEGLPSLREWDREGLSYRFSGMMIQMTRYTIMPLNAVNKVRRA